jgi:hypothetical protein
MASQPWEGVRDKNPCSPARGDIGPRFDLMPPLTGLKEYLPWDDYPRLARRGL